jgi:hypothetical protein
MLMLILEWRIAKKLSEITLRLLKVTITIFSKQLILRFNPTDADGIFNKGEALVFLGKI